MIQNTNEIKCKYKDKYKIYTNTKYRGDKMGLGEMEQFSGRNPRQITQEKMGKLPKP